MIVLCGNLTIPYCGRFFHCFYLEERKNCATALAGHRAAILFNLDYLNKLTKLDLLVIDDFGLMDLDLDKCRDLFEVLDTRDGRKSTVVISQFPVSSWFDMFSDNTYADACLTRITDKHHTYRLEMNGANMRNTD